MALHTAEVLQQKISAVGKSAGELQSAIQEVAVQAVGYSIEHGDIRFGQKLFDVLPSGVRRASLVAFLEKHGNFAWSKEEKCFKFFKGLGEPRVYDETALMAISWATATKETIVSSYDLESIMTKAIKAMEKAFKEHEKSGVKIENSEVYDYLVSARDSYNSQKYSEQPELKVA
jgi:predicted transcriptional regulator